MKAIGFRVEPKAIHYAVVEGSVEAPVVVSTDRFSAPLSYGDGAKLVWYRKRLIAEIQGNDAKAVGIRFPESNSQGAGSTSAMQRLRIEGVVMEAAASIAVPIQSAGGVQHIRRKLGSDHSPKDYQAGLKELRGIRLADYTKNMQDAILVAICALARDD